MDFLAHKTEDGRVQTVREHLEGTARLCAAFARQFDAEEHGYLAGIAHDIGKYSDAFQKRLDGGPKVDHASAGAFECYQIGAGAEAICVAGHHGGLPDFGNGKVDRAGDSTVCGRLKKVIEGKIPPYREHWNGTLPKPAKQPSLQTNLSVAAWTRMLYSCLVDADYLDTERFMQPQKPIRGRYETMEALLAKLERHVEKWSHPTSDINRSRWQILQDCQTAGERERGVYTLSVPTGGGKTVSSMAFALRHAVRHGMQRVIYVIPYTSIIEQNAAVFREIFGEQNVLEHHSGKLYDLSENADENERALAQATENWDMPIVVTTAVQFFESFYSNRSSKCRKLHNIANSVVIFDEAQMIPVCHLAPCVSAIAELAAHFNSTAVLCTATQPALDDLFLRFGWKKPIPQICGDQKALNNKFARVSFANAGKLSREETARQLSEHEQVLCIVNSRRAAQEVYELLPKEGSFHLSTLMYPMHRRAMLDTIRARLANGETCRVVSTSLIEAGVDVDFPAVWRETAGMDSILQAAGRCNREGTRDKASSVVTIFESEDRPPDLLEKNVGATREALAGGADPADPQTVNAYFSALRDLVGDGIDKSQLIEKFERGIAGCGLPFKQAAEAFHMIDRQTFVVYIPTKENGEILERLKQRTADREDYRLAGRYGVSIYDRHYRALLDAGDIEPLDEDSAILIHSELYDENRGLSLKESESGKGWIL